MCYKSPAKLLRSVKRITKFIEQKTETPVIFPPIDFTQLGKTPADKLHPLNDPPPVDEPPPPQLMNLNLNKLQNSNSWK